MGQIRNLSQTLNLVEAPQDWGITNSDPARVGEFLHFCESVPLTAAQQFAMGELVLASMNDALVEGADGVDYLERFLALGLLGLPQHVRYWSSLDDEEFPIAARLRGSSIQA